MNVHRGQVVLVDFPFSKGAGTKVRPALVAQDNTDNDRLVNTILAQITGTTHRALQETQVLIVANSNDGQRSGLRFDSVVNCANLVTADKSRILRALGSHSEDLMLKVGSALKAALDLR